MDVSQHMPKGEMSNRVGLKDVSQHMPKHVSQHMPKHSQKHQDVQDVAWTTANEDADVHSGTEPLQCAREADVGAR
jgi:hypothetical protein